MGVRLVPTDTLGEESSGSGEVRCGEGSDSSKTAPHSAAPPYSTRADSRKSPCYQVYVIPETSRRRF